MSSRPLAISLLLVLGAVLVQTTLFARVRPFQVAPDLVLLTVLATVRHLPGEPGVLVGFTGGLLSDLLGVSPLGLRALVLTVVAFLAVRFRERLETNLPMAIVGVAALTLLGETLFAVVGTLFGRGLLSDALLMRKLMLTTLYNVVLAAAVFPLVSLALEPGRGKGWVS